jgi:hypothetical protein
MSNEFCVLGYGAMVSERAKEPKEVFQAHDAGGTTLGDGEEPKRWGSRHRSIFRLCNEHSDVLALVVSQDGGSKIVKQVGGKVVYWEISQLLGTR